MLFHWQAPGYLMLFPLLGEATARGMAYSRRSVKTWLVASVALFILLVSALASHTATGWMAEAMPQWFQYGDPSLDAVDWDNLPASLAKEGMLSQPVGFIAAPNWIDASKISYVMGKELPVLCLNSKEPHHFAFMFGQSAFRGQNALLIARKDLMDRAYVQYKPYFASVEPLGSVWIERMGRPALELSVFRGLSYSGSYPLPYGLK